MGTKQSLVPELPEPRVWELTINPMRVCGLGGGVGGDDACGIWEFLLPERAAGPPTHPHCRYPSPFLHLKLGPGDDRAEISCR